LLDSFRLALVTPLFQQGFARQIFAALIYRKLSSVAPLLGAGEHLLTFTLNFFPRRHGARTRGFNLNQRVFHLLNHQPDQLFRIFGPIQHTVDIGIDNITHP
jgi:hypothetical protein